MLPGKNVLLNAQIYIAADKYHVSGFQDYIRPVLLGDLRNCEEELKPEEDHVMGPEERWHCTKSLQALLGALHLLLEQSHGEDKLRERLLGINWSLITAGPCRPPWVHFVKSHSEYAADVIAFQSQQDWQSKLLVIEEEIFRGDGTPGDDGQIVDQ